MNCSDFNQILSAFVDGQLTETDHREASTHLGACYRCNSSHRSMDATVSAVGALPHRRSPEELSLRLRVIASHAAARRRTRRSVKIFARHCLHTIRLWSDNLMRPLAIPAFGGLASSVMLFSMLVPTFTTVKPLSGPVDVPTVLITGATFDQAKFPVPLNQDEVVVDLVLDEQGEMIEYSIVDNPAMMKNADARRNIEQYLLFARFAPATKFGQPLTSRLRVSIRGGSSIDVRG